MVRNIPQYKNTEEHFLLSSLSEFVKVWACGNQAFMNVKCESGRATLSLGFQLGAPQSPHNYFPHQNPFPYQVRQKGPARLARDRERAAKHQEKRNARTNNTTDPVASNPTQPNTTADPAESTNPHSVSPPPVSQSKAPCPSAASPAVTSQNSTASVENYNPNMLPPPPALEKAQPPPPPADPAVTSQTTAHTTSTPPSVRPSSLLFPPDPPKKQPQGTRILTFTDYPYTIEALHRDFPITKQINQITQEDFVKDINRNFSPEKDFTERTIRMIAKSRGLTISGLPIDQTPAAGTTTASTPSGQATTSFPEQTPSSLTPTTATTSVSSSTTQENLPLSGQGSVVKNLNTIFQHFTPSPPSSHLLHLNHSAVLLLPDEIHAKVRKKVKHVTKGCDTKDEKVRTLIHRTIMEITERYGYTYNSFEKIFYT